MNKSTETESFKGLTSAEAEKLLKQFGKNTLESAERFWQLKQLLKILSDPMGFMLLSLSALYFLIGDRTDALIILLAYIPITAVDVFLELRSEKALKALKSNMKTSAKVLRDGVLKEIPIQWIVPGDVIAFEEGQSLPADGRVLSCHDFVVSEAALTGESLPIEKSSDQLFFAGTSVLSGRGWGRVEKTAGQTELGKISHLLKQAEAEDSPLQKKVHGLVKKVVGLAVGLVLLLFVIEYLRGVSVIKALITSLTFGMATIPEEFPLVFTLYLSMGAYRLSKHGVLVKTLPSVEALGNVDVICTDKTGTLTEGRFRLVETVPFGSIAAEERDLISILACEPTPVDAMEMAIFEKIVKAQGIQKEWKLQYDYPFEAQGKHMTHVWVHGDGKQLLAMKGAVEGVLEHAQIDPQAKANVLAVVNRLASEGKRILGLATKRGVLSGERFQDEKGVEFVGLLVFSDPVRGSAKEAIQECQQAGIEIKMLTGDHPLTAHAIAEELDIHHQENAIYNGAQLAAMSLEQRVHAYLGGSIFARVTPEQKYEMIKTLKENNKVVAMTGDGVNDSPALKLADIGVSMGENATDVARSTAKMVLLKNDFKGIVHAMLEGRNIFANLRRSFAYLISFHIPVVLLAFIPPLIGWDQILLPIHIILLELIVHPISAFAFENLKSDEKNVTKSLLPRSTAFTAIFSGVLLSVLSLSSLLPVLSGSSSLDFSYTRSLVLATILFGNIGFTLVEAWPHFKSVRVLSIVAVLALLPVLFCNVGFLAETFRLSPLSLADFLKSLILGMAASFPTFLYRRWQSCRAQL